MAGDVHRHQLFLSDAGNKRLIFGVGLKLLNKRRKEVANAADPVQEKIKRQKRKVGRVSSAYV